MRTTRCLSVLIISLIIIFPSKNVYSQIQAPVNESPSLNASRISIDPQTGTAMTSLSIEVPPGRGGVSPDLSLTYNSGTQNSVFGVGWALGLGSIQRSTKKGVPAYNSSDRFVFAQSGSVQELIYDSSASLYYPEIEGSFLKIEKISSPDHWRVTDKNGNKYYFGLTDDARQNNGQNVFQWLLSKVEDVHGNYMTITYDKFTADRQNYLKKIQYTANDAAPGGPLGYYAEVEFILQNRDMPYSSYIPGFLVKTTQRVDKIVVKANNNVQRIYELDYAQSASSRRDLLTSVSRIGKDEVTSLPATIYSYTKRFGCPHCRH